MYTSSANSTTYIAPLETSTGSEELVIACWTIACSSFAAKLSKLGPEKFLPDEQSTSSTSAPIETELEVGLPSFCLYCSTIFHQLARFGYSAMGFEGVNELIIVLTTGFILASQVPYQMR